jgi:F-type H+-transporting ATPase subunit delta
MSLTNYAKALFEIALEKERIDLINDHFDDFTLSLKHQKQWIDIMDSPMISFSKKTEMIDELKYDSSFLSFIKTLAQKHIMYMIFDINEEWTNLTRIYQKIAHLHVISAKELSKEQQQRVKKAIEPRFPGRTVSLKFSINEALIGGIKVIYRGQSLDHSVQRELLELYTTI